MAIIFMIAGMSPGCRGAANCFAFTVIPLCRNTTTKSCAIDPDFIAIVSVRSLPDIDVSYVDHIEKRGTGPLDIRVAHSTEGNRFYSSLSDEEKHQYIIDFIMPWFSRYMASWLNWGDVDRLRIIKYEDIANNIKNVILDIFEFSREFGIDFKLKCGIDYNFIDHYNKGVSGRGLKILSGRQIMQLREQAKIVKNYPLGPEIHQYLIEGQS